MNRRTRNRTYIAVAVAATVATASAAACGGSSSVPSGLGALEISQSADTVAGTGQLNELQQKRAEWLARGINDYRVQMHVSCFCGSTITRPVLLEVRGGAVSKVWDLETSKLVTDLEPYPSITTLFDRAVAKRAGNGNVSVAYDRTLGFPARIEIGTIANDAGIVYTLGALTRL